MIRWVAHSLFLPTQLNYWNVFTRQQVEKIKAEKNTVEKKQVDDNSYHSPVCFIVPTQRPIEVQVKRDRRVFRNHRPQPQNIRVNVGDILILNIQMFWRINVKYETTQDSGVHRDGTVQKGESESVNSLRHNRFILFKSSHKRDYIDDESYEYCQGNSMKVETFVPQIDSDSDSPMEKKKTVRTRSEIKAAVKGKRNKK